MKKRERKNKQKKKIKTIRYEAESFSQTSGPKLQTKTLSISPYIVTDSSTIVYIARQLYTHSKNVSLLCFLYTKGGL